MAWDHDILMRLDIAHRKTKEISDNNALLGEDIFPGANLAMHWPVVTGAYSGIEQTLKFIIAKEKGVEVSKLLEKRRNRNPYLTHNLSWLFSKLSPEIQDKLRKFYRQYQSLHVYIPIDNLDEFLRRVSGENGYTLWRYGLIDTDKPIPTNSPDTMIEIWTACVDIATDKCYENDPTMNIEFRMPIDKLVSALDKTFNDTFNEVSIEHQQVAEVDGQQLEAVNSEFYEWGRKNGGLLNAFIQALRHFHQHGSHGQPDLSEWLDDILARWLLHVRDKLFRFIEDPVSVRVFVNRACGRLAYEGKGLRWNSETQLFEGLDLEG